MTSGEFRAVDAQLNAVYRELDKAAALGVSVTVESICNGHQRVLRANLVVPLPPARPAHEPSRIWQGEEKRAEGETSEERERRRLDERRHINGHDKGSKP